MGEQEKYVKYWQGLWHWSC